MVQYRQERAAQRLRGRGTRGTDARHDPHAFREITDDPVIEGDVGYGEGLGVLPAEYSTARIAKETIRQVTTTQSIERKNVYAGPSEAPAWAGS